MKKFLLLTAIFMISGCAYKSNSTPQVPIEGIRMEWDRGKDYEVLGDTEGTGCTLSILNEWLSAKLRAVGLLEGDSKSGYLLNGPVGINPGTGFLSILLGGPESYTATTIATYNAIESFKGADFVLPVRSTADRKDYVLWWRDCSTVTGKAVKVKR